IVPEIHHASGGRGARELVDLIETKSRTFEIGRSRVEPGPGLFSGIDVVLDPDVTEAVQVAARAHRSHAAREIEAREALGQVRVDARPGWVEEMLVDHHESRDHRFFRKVDDLRTGRHGDRSRGAECSDATIADDDGLIITSWSTSSV